MTPGELSRAVKAEARRLGFELVAVGPAEPPEHGAAFEAWLDAGYAGELAYLERTRARRLDPAKVLPGARAVIACGLNYYQGEAADGEPAHVSRYAWGRDYHAVLEPRLRALLGFLQRERPGTEGKLYVDTGPVLERDLAARAGLGWIGKNTNLIHPTLGSWFFIGVLLVTAELEPDAPIPDHCGSCSRCLEACPTQAFVAPYVLDARRCISYLTIEQRGPIPVELRPAVGGLAFGCDICQAVCPWNNKAPLTLEAAFFARGLPVLEELVALSDEEFRLRLGRSALRRARRPGLARNAAVALGNLGDPAAVPALVRALGAGEPLARAHAAWALGRIRSREARAALETARARETEPEVLEEIAAALAGGEAEEAHPSEATGGR